MAADPVPAEDSALTRTRALPGHREQQFWKHYSPHHELPLSGTLSLTIHGLVLALLLAGGFLALKLGLADKNKPLQLSALIVQGQPGPGNPNEKTNPGGGQDKPQEIVGGPTDPATPNLAPTDIKDIKPPHPDDVQLPLDQADPKNHRTNNPVGAIDWGHSEKELRDLIEGHRSESGPPSNKVGTGPKPGPAGVGPGIPGGTGSGGSPPGRLASIEDMRHRRWKLIINTANGVDYRDQLRSLGAILAIPQNDGRLWVLRDLLHPKAGKVESPSSLPGFFWFDNQPDSVHRLAQALRLPDPPLFVVFMSQKVEDELLAKELERYHGPENRIVETDFQLRWNGGKFDFVVVNQIVN